MGRILLVRHGQASWGSDDYDRLSETGHEQARLLGRVLAERGVRPTTVVRGAMRRHRETAEGLLEGAGWATEVREEAGWDEFDHVEVLGRHPAPWGDGDPPGREAFGTWFDAALARWTDGHHDLDYRESFATFGRRVRAAADELASDLGADGHAVVVTSGGPVARVVAALVTDEADASAPWSEGAAEAGAVWRRLNVVLANASLTTLAARAEGPTLVTFNEHAYLEPHLLTFR